MYLKQLIHDHLFYKKFFKGVQCKKQKWKGAYKRNQQLFICLKKKSHFCFKTFFFKTHFLFENFILEISVNIFDGTENYCQQLAVL